MFFSLKNRGLSGLTAKLVGILLLVILVAGQGVAQIDSRNQARPEREQPAGATTPQKKKRIKGRKRKTRKTKEKSYSNKKQLKQAQRRRIKKPERGYQGDITGRKRIRQKATRSARQITYPQPNPYSGRKIKTEKTRAGPPAPPVRYTERRGERARTGDISGRRRIRQQATRSAPRLTYPQPNPYTGRKIKTEKQRARPNRQIVRSVRTSPQPAFSRKNQRQGVPRPVAPPPKIRTKRKVYRYKDRPVADEKASTRDIAGRKLRTKNKSSARPITGGRTLSNVNPYIGRKKLKEGERFGKAATRQPQPRTTPPPPPNKYARDKRYGRYKDHRSKRTPTVVLAAPVRSQTQPTGKGEKPRFGKKYHKKSVRTTARQPERAYPPRVPPVSAVRRKRPYRQPNTYKYKDKRFARERAFSGDIAGRPLRKRNYRSPRPDNIGSGYVPYYGRVAPAGKPARVAAGAPRNTVRARWNNQGQPLPRKYGPGAVSGYRGKTPLGAIGGISAGRESRYTGNIKAKKLRRYGPSGVAAYSGNIKARKLRKYGPSGVGAFAGTIKVGKPLQGGGSISRHWNNNGQPLMRKGRSNAAIAISGFSGKQRSPGKGRPGPGPEGNYRGTVPLRNMRSYGRGPEGLYAGNLKARKPLQGGGSISRHWNNNGQPLMRKGRSNAAIAISGFSGKQRSPGKPRSAPGPEGLYAGNLKARKPLQGGGSITRHWNNNGQPLMRKGRSNAAIAISGFSGKQRSPGKPRSAPGPEGLYAGNLKARKPLQGGGSITRHWNNNGQPLMRKGRSNAAIAISGFSGKQRSPGKPRSAPGPEGLYAGNIKARKPQQGGGSITRHWNNKGQPLMRKERSDAAMAISGFSGKQRSPGKGRSGPGPESSYTGTYRAAGAPVKGGGSVTRHWNNKGKPLDQAPRSKAAVAAANFRGRYRAPAPGDRAAGPEGRYSGDRKLKKKEIKDIKGIGYGNRKKFLFVYLGKEAGTMGPYGKPGPAYENTVSPKVKTRKHGQPPGTERGRTYSPNLITLGNPTHMGLHREVTDSRKNKDLPKDLRGSHRLRLIEAKGLDNGRKTTLAFLPANTKGGLIRSNPARIKGRLHPSSKYTLTDKPRNSLEEKSQPIKLRLWLTSLFGKNANQPKAVKQKVRRPRYDKGERELWETMEREDWYKN